MNTYVILVVLLVLSVLVAATGLGLYIWLQSASSTATVSSATTPYVTASTGIATNAAPYQAISGTDSNGNTVYACSGSTAGGVRPGYAVGGSCYIPYNNAITTLTSGWNYLTSNTPFTWVSNTQTPPNPVTVNGWNSCRVGQYAGRVQQASPGAGCDIAQNGGEVHNTTYDLLST